MSYKCKGTSKHGACPLRDDCFRFTRESDKNQKYYDKMPYEENGNKCDFYLPHWLINDLKQSTNGSTDYHSNGKARGNTDQ